MVDDVVVVVADDDDDDDDEGWMTRIRWLARVFAVVDLSVAESAVTTRTCTWYQGLLHSISNNLVVPVLLNYPHTTVHTIILSILMRQAFGHSIATGSR